jgi:hypothetical protein
MSSRGCLVLACVEAEGWAMLADMFNIGERTVFSVVVGKKV